MLHNGSLGLVLGGRYLKQGALLQATKHHPASVDLELVKRLITTTKTSTLQSFLCKEFSNISKDYAGAIQLRLWRQTAASFRCFVL